MSSNEGERQMLLGVESGRMETGTGTENSVPGGYRLERGSAAWFDGQYCSLEAGSSLAHFRAEYCAEWLIYQFFGTILN